MTKVLVTGGAGFIGSNFVRYALERHADWHVTTLDKLTYAGRKENLHDVMDNPRHTFVHGDIADAAVSSPLVERSEIVVHFAAETHVDRSIRGPAAFVDTNVVGTLAFLECVREWWAGLPGGERTAFRFLHVSTDEVYGALRAEDPPFSETTPYAPNSPYAASKAASDHLVRAYHHTYGLPTLTTNCSNNYGPLQFPEKLIPLMIVNALAGKPLPVYGDGRQVRDWLHVRDHCAAIRAVLARGRPGETYNVGGDAEQANIDVVRTLCRLIAARRPELDCEGLITFVTDRPGHDRRYAINAAKIRGELGWRPAHTFESGIRDTVDWYLANDPWLASVQSAEYRRWVDVQYA